MRKFEVFFINSLRTGHWIFYACSNKLPSLRKISLKNCHKYPVTTDLNKYMRKKVDIERNELFSIMEMLPILEMHILEILPINLRWFIHRQKVNKNLIRWMVKSQWLLAPDMKSPNQLNICIETPFFIFIVNWFFGYT